MRGAENTAACVTQDVGADSVIRAGAATTVPKAMLWLRQWLRLCSPFLSWVFRMKIHRAAASLQVILKLSRRTGMFLNVNQLFGNQLYKVKISWNFSWVTSTEWICTSCKSIWDFTRGHAAWSQQAAASRVLGKCWRFRVLAHGHMTLTDWPVEGEATCGPEARRQSVEQPGQSASSNVFKKKQRRLQLHMWFSFHPNKKWNREIAGHDGPVAGSQVKSIIRNKLDLISGLKQSGSPCLCFYLTAPEDGNSSVMWMYCCSLFFMGNKVHQIPSHW